MSSSGLREVCRGRWGAILPALGVSEKTLSGKPGPCPICGGKDRFRYDDRDSVGGWICNRCGAGDGFSLLMKIHCLDFPSVAKLVEAIAGEAPKKPRQKQADDRLRAAMNGLWRAGTAVAAGDPVAAYLAKRGITILPIDTRYVASCRYDQNGAEPRTFPAMLARITGADDQPVNVHRTYLSPELPQKAAVEAPRKLMPGKTPKGSAIHLMSSDPWLGIAEGIETALSAAQLFHVPVWSAVNSSLLMHFEPPPGTTELAIFGDRDPQFGGQSAAYALAHRLSTQRPNLKVTVHIPGPITGRDKIDWNDWLVAA